MIPAKKITLLTLGRDQTVTDLREIFEVQMQAEYFPVQLDRMGATFEFLQIADASQHFTGINNVETVVSAQRHNHPGGAYSFRIERNGKVLVVCTDVEHGEQIVARSRSGLSGEANSSAFAIGTTVDPRLSLILNSIVRQRTSSPASRMKQRHSSTDSFKAAFGHYSQTAPPHK